MFAMGSLNLIVCGPALLSRLIKVGSGIDAVESPWRLLIWSTSYTVCFFGPTSSLNCVNVSFSFSFSAWATFRLAVLTTERAREAKCSVESDSCKEDMLGETAQSITHRAEPPKDSLRRWVSFELR